MAGSVRCISVSCVHYFLKGLTSQRFDALFVGAGGDDNDIVGVTPLQQDGVLVHLLAAVFRDALSDLFEHRIQSRALVSQERSQGAEGLGEDAMLSLEVQQILNLGQDLRMIFHLVDGWLVFAGLDDGFDVLWSEIRHADGLQEAVVFELLKDFPGRNELFRCTGAIADSVGLVNQEETVCAQTNESARKRRPRERKSVD